MFKWSCDLHNNTNRIKKPPSPLMNWETIYKEYELNSPESDTLTIEENEIILKTPFQRANDRIYQQTITKK